MMIYLHVEQGPHSGRRIDLRSGQIATIGNTDYADFNFEKDQLMADVHCRISVEQDQVLLENLNASAETLVDGSPVNKVNLANGSQIQCGQTIINVKYDEASAPDSFNSGSPEDESEEENPDLLRLAKILELSDDAIILAESQTQADLFVDELREKEFVADAIRLQAYLLPKDKAIYWVSSMIDELGEIELSQEQLAAKDAAGQWANEPDEDKRRHCEKLAEETDYSGIGGMLALAAFFSEGSIAPSGSEEDILVDKYLSSQVLAGTIHAVVGECPPENSEEIYLKFLDQAKEHA